LLAASASWLLTVLSVYLHDEVHSLRFRLIGQFSGPDALDFERSWKTAVSTLSGRILLIDLSEINSTDPAGRQVLGRIAALGARFISGSTLSESLARDISGRNPGELPSPKLSLWRWIRCRVACCCQAAQTSAAKCLGCWHGVRRIW
jgi:hypothetical protein